MNPTEYQRLARVVEVANASVEKLADDFPATTIEEYRASMRRDGRFVSDSYDRMCSTCGMAPVHKSSKSGVCTDCGQKMRSSSKTKVSEEQ